MCGLSDEEVSGRLSALRKAVENIASPGLVRARADFATPVRRMNHVPERDAVVAARSPQADLPLEAVGVEIGVLAASDHDAGP